MADDNENGADERTKDGPESAKGDHDHPVG